ncbi:hypothetical protein QBC33DRAFT_560225 [Phialemonium atrogriseum]|uniref:Uncharacterized protein n=1 Tax=Phialemonium atrogriseum TaxID=1093897 RepID=A0AAJ0C065_9PEZI|nr:uncharacterized protein QBC33DRAFT_560225 [Phialemonium atrogriseum]KAK1766324.1 hypothetical protein QBC33DRAFT_560225 [Phialemonium atrogriseum]
MLCFSWGTAQCFWVDSGPGSPGSDEAVETPCSYGNTTDLLVVNQTWTWHDTDAAHPITFNATGSVTLVLDCSED